MNKFYLLILMNVFIFISNAQAIVQDLRPGMDGSNPQFQNTARIGNEVYFTAVENGMGSCLYKTDGSTITRIEGNPSNYTFYRIVGVLNDELIYHSVLGYDFKLNKTNGQVDAGEVLYSFNMNSFTIPNHHHIVVNDVMYFYGAEDDTGEELWRTDGTTQGTFLVKDINPGNQSSWTFALVEDHPFFVEMDGIIYFSAKDEAHDNELWRSDGTESGTFLVKDIDPSSNNQFIIGSTPNYLTYYQGALYFSAYRSVDGRELWKTDGTEQGTVLVKDIAAGNSHPRELTVFENHLYFVADHGTYGNTVFKSDGTSEVTIVLKTPDNNGPIGAGKLYHFKNLLFFYANDKLWKSNGTVAGTVEMPSPTGINWISNFLYPTTNFIYFLAYDDNGEESLYRSTDQNNTMVRLTDPGFDFTFDTHFQLINDCILFSGDDGNFGPELYGVCNQITSPLSISKEEQLTMILYPNPFKDELYLQFGEGNLEIKEVSLVDLAGKEIEISYQWLDQNNMRFNEMSQLKSGIYFLRLITKNGVVLTQKIVTQLLITK